MGLSALRVNNMKFDNPDRYNYIIDDQASETGNIPDFIVQLGKRKMAITINPDHPYKILFDLGVLIIILIDSYIIPFQLAFRTHEVSEFEISITFYSFFIYLIDIVLNFITLVPENRQIDSYRKIAIYYFQTWFVIDFLAIVPSSLTVTGLMDPQNTQLNIMRLFRLLRILKLMKFFEKLTDMFFGNKFILGLLQFTKLMMIVMFLSHFLSCIFNRIADIQQQVFNWQSNIGVIFEANIVKYMTGVYWAVLTMITIGYGDVVPRTQDELYFGIFSIIFSCIVFGFVLGKVGELITGEDEITQHYIEKEDLVYNYLRRKSIETHVSYKIKQYWDFYAQLKTKQDQEEKIQELLNSEIKKLLHQYLRTHESNFLVEFLSNFLNTSFLRTLIVAFKEEVYIPYQYIMREEWGAPVSDRKMVFCDTYDGILIVERTSTTVPNFTKTQEVLLGIYETLTNSNYYFSALSQEHQTVIQLYYKEFQKILSQYEFIYDKEFYCMQREDLAVYQKLHTARLCCPFCNATSHWISKCSMEHYDKQHATIIQ